MTKKIIERSKSMPIESNLDLRAKMAEVLDWMLPLVPEENEKIDAILKLVDEHVIGKDTPRLRKYTIGWVENQLREQQRSALYNTEDGVTK
jgi:hypothetical protein